jgi:hypothetical protein
MVRRLMLIKCVPLLLGIFAAGSAEPATITVTSPPLNKIYYERGLLPIAWTQEGYTGQTVAIYLKKTASDIPFRTIANAALATGSYSWTIPDDVTEGQYQVRVSGNGTGAPWDDGDVFWIKRNIASNLKDLPIKQLKEKEGFTPGPPSASSCTVVVTSPVHNQWCYVDRVCTISWVTSNLTGYGSVFIGVVQFDAQHLAGWGGASYPVANTGSYSWVVPENVGPLEAAAYKIEIKTADGKCEGMSGLFGIKKRLPVHVAPKGIMKMNK